MLVNYNSKSKIFLIGCLIFIFGVALASFLPVEILYFAIVWFSTGIFFLILTVLFWRYNKETGIKLASLFFLLIAILLNRKTQSKV